MSQAAPFDPRPALAVYLHERGPAFVELVRTLETLLTRSGLPPAVFQEAVRLALILSTRNENGPPP